MGGEVSAGDVQRAAPGRREQLQGQLSSKPWTTPGSSLRNTTTITALVSPAWGPVTEVRAGARPTVGPVPSPPHACGGQTQAQGPQCWA